MIYGYCRVSTKGQDVYGNGMDVQVAQVEAAGAVDVRCETYTGTTMARPVWDALVDEVVAGDTVIVSKVDRIARTASAGYEAVKELIDKGVSVRILNMGMVDDTPMGRLLLHVMLAFAEFDRDMLVERMAAGREAARRKDGYRDGRKPLDVDEEAVRECVEAGLSVRKAAEVLGVSERTYRRRRDVLLESEALLDVG